MDACPGHILESTKEIDMKLSLMTNVKGRAVHKNHNHTLYIYKVIPL